MAEIKADLKNINIRIENLKTIGKTLFAAGQTVLYETKKNWLSGKGADGNSVKPYSTNYLKYRQREGLSTVPNMLRTGAMQRGLRVTSGKTSTTAQAMARTAEIGVTADQRDKLRHNVAIRGNLMSASDNAGLVQKITAYVLRKLQGK